MADEPEVLYHMDDESISWQNCAICGQQKQRVIRQPNRPDYALCDNCQSAFVLEKGGQMRMLYARIPENMPKTKAFALKKWQRYFDIRTIASQETAGKTEVLPPEVEVKTSDTIPSIYANHQESYMDLEAQKADILYSRAKKLEPPPRALRDTGELPDLDALFKDFD